MTGYIHLLQFQYAFESNLGGQEEQISVGTTIMVTGEVNVYSKYL